MIDPNLAPHQFSFSQLPQGFSPGPNVNVNVSMGNANLSEQQEVEQQRVLPNKNVTDETMDEAYVQFLLYCNPGISTDVDTTELKRGFRNPPRSDGKSFSIFELYRLISRLERRDLKTWTQLVVEMGVELPDTSKNQSTQKVQQYAVRLKVSQTYFSIQ